MSRNRARYFCLGLTLFLLLALNIAPVFAADLSFHVDSSDVNLTMNNDGTATIDYVYSFSNDPGGGIIDFVDIGLPTNDYNLANVSAEINGMRITDIADSPYVKPGVALGLGSGSIQPGQHGTLHFLITGVGSMLYKTTKVENVQEPYASFQFSPNSFSSNYAHGQTQMSVTLHLPTGLQSQEPRYFTPQNWPGSPDPQSAYDADGRVIYNWTASNANSYTQYIFGAAFPARIVPVGSLSSEPLVSNNFLDQIFPWLCCLSIGGIVGFVTWTSMVGSRRRSMQYLPPKISVEGNGIKRGLTAVQAAILMETPMDKVLRVSLFSVIKKGAVEVVTREPLVLKALPQPTAELYPYEKAFVEAMATPGISNADRRKKLQDLMVLLVRNVSELMRGFSRKETIAYYEDIMKKAWAQIEAADTPEIQMQAFDQNMEWTMLDRDFNDHSQTVFTRPIIVPMWWGRYDPSFGRSSSSSSSSGPVQVGQAPSTMSLPSLPGSAFAASIAGGIQSISSNVVGDLNSFTSNITNTTNPLPKPTSSGRSSGGGHSCACACACAGCACACAGGGR